MSTAPAVTRYRLGPWSSGSLMTPEEFDAAEFEEGWRYQLIHEVLAAAAPSRAQPQRGVGALVAHLSGNPSARQRPRPDLARGNGLYHARTAAAPTG